VIRLAGQFADRPALRHGNQAFIDHVLIGIKSGMDDVSADLLHGCGRLNLQHLVSSSMDGISHRDRGDATPQGHTNRVVGDQPALVTFVRLSGD